MVNGSYTHAVPPQVSRLVNRPHFLLVSVTRTTMFVYRSLQLPVTDDWYAPVKDLIEDAELVSRVIVEDPDMMLGKAEHSIYALSDD